MLTAQKREKLQQKNRLRNIRETIKRETREVRSQVKRAERKIDRALKSAPKNWFGIGEYIEVFAASKKVRPKVRNLLKRLYDAGGYDLRWERTDSGTELNSVRMDYLTGT